jgi:hypothetical protein
LHRREYLGREHRDLIMAGKKGQAPRHAFSQALFDAICARIALGASLRTICAEPDMPDRRTFNLWRQKSAELQAQYDQACLDREDQYFEEIIDLADSCRMGEKRVTKANGDIEVTEIDMVERAKVQIAARQWSLARMNRKKYGDKLGVDGGEDGAPIQVQIVRFGTPDADDKTS